MIQTMELDYLAPGDTDRPAVAHIREAPGDTTPLRF
jgi:hypothetical protein